MANLGEMSGAKQWGLALGAAVLVSTALFFTYFKTQRDANEKAQKALDAKLQENAELDGPYYSMLGFFDQVSKLERIVNVSNLQVATTKKASEAKAKHTYKYAPNESVVATCVATTFFSHDAPAPVATPAKGKAKGRT